MNANVHTPERLSGETFADYRERRQRSHAMNKEARDQGISGRQASRAEHRANQRRSGNARKHIGFADTYMASLAMKRAEALALKPQFRG